MLCKTDAAKQSISEIFKSLIDPMKRKNGDCKGCGVSTEEMGSLG